MTQQAVRSELCSRTIPQLDATVAVAESIWGPDIVYATKDVSEYLELFLPIRSAMVNGFSNLASTGHTAVPFTCPTGNCTFPPYESLGYCSRCVDVKASVVETPCPSEQLGRFCTNFSMPAASPLKIVWDYGYGILLNGLSSRPNFGSPRSGNYDLNITLMTFTRARCANFTPAPGEVLQAPYFKNNSDLLWKCPPSPGLPSIPANNDILAVNCTVYACLKRYQGEVRGGVLHESVLSERPLAVAPFIDVYRPGRNEATALVAPKFPCRLGADLYDASNVSAVPPSTPDLVQVEVDDRRAALPPQCVYAATDLTVLKITAFLWKVTTADCTMNFAMVGPICSDWWQEGLFNNGFATFESVSGIFANVTTSMTNQMRVFGRSAARTGPGTASGTSQEIGLCLRVDWPWLLFLAGLVLSTAVLLGCMIVANHRNRSSVPVWKSSTLPYLFLGSDGALASRASSRLAEMDSAIGRTTANIEVDADGWKLAAHTSGVGVSTTDQAGPENASERGYAWKAAKQSVPLGVSVATRTPSPLGRE